jgi:porphobilinogen synthase
MVRETELRPSDFIYPLFVVEGRNVRRPITSMPGVFNFSVDLAVEEARAAHKLGIPSVILFGIPDTKDARGSGAYERKGIIPRAVRELKAALPELEVIADICLCEFTDHGHCGLIQGQEVDNDSSLPLLADMALACAEAGVDMVAPSDMMDGRVGAIRRTLDESGFSRLPIMSYAAKYASGFYGPFREAAQSAPQFGDRRGYQMDPANAREALKEVAQDIEEGADLVMVKPALSYLDIIHRVKAATQVPVAAYNVSGEYAMLKAAAQNGWIDYNRVMMEVLTSIKRAGADLILTYHALDAARLLAG